MNPRAAAWLVCAALLDGSSVRVEAAEETSVQTPGLPSDEEAAVLCASSEAQAPERVFEVVIGHYAGSTRERVWDIPSVRSCTHSRFARVRPRIDGYCRARVESAAAQRDAAAREPVLRREFAQVMHSYATLERECVNELLRPNLLARLAEADPNSVVSEFERRLPVLNEFLCHDPDRIVEHYLDAFVSAARDEATAVCLRGRREQALEDLRRRCAASARDLRSGPYAFIATLRGDCGAPR